MDTLRHFYIEACVTVMTVFMGATLNHTIDMADDMEVVTNFINYDYHTLLVKLEEIDYNMAVAKQLDKVEAAAFSNEIHNSLYKNAESILRLRQDMRYIWDIKLNPIEERPGLTQEQLKREIRRVE